MVIPTSDVWRSVPSPMVPKNVSKRFRRHSSNLSILTFQYTRIIFYPSKGQMMNMCWRQLGDGFYSAQQQRKKVTKCKLVVKNMCYDKASCKIYNYCNIILGSFIVSLFNFILIVTRENNFCTFTNLVLTIKL